MNKIKELTKLICAGLSQLDIDERIAQINNIKQAIHKISPFNNEPVDCVIWVKNNQVQANDYNPNSVAPPEMDLLRLSIENDGYTQPIVSMESGDEVEVVDGFHRNRIGKECEDIKNRIYGYLPIVKIRKSQEGINDRVAATIRHNRARGKHKVGAMSDLVADLKKRNWSNKKIAKELGMDRDEVLRLSQITGLTELFSNKEFSLAWEAEEILNPDGEDIPEKIETNA